MSDEMTLSQLAEFIDKGFGKLEGQFAEVKATVGELKTTVGELKTSHEEFKTAVGDLKTSHEELKSSHEEFKTTVGELKTSHDELKTSHDNLLAEFKEFKAVENKRYEQIKESLRENIQSIGEHFAEANKRIDLMDNRFDEMRKATLREIRMRVEQVEGSRISFLYDENSIHHQTLKEHEVRIAQLENVPV